MATNILMPALSPTMTEGTLARWLKAEGDRIKAGDVIAEIETDKATMEVEAVDEGILGRILVPAGSEGVKVNDPIAVLVDAGEAIPSAAIPAAAAPAPAPPMPQPATPAAAPAASARAADDARIIASPLARRMAQQAGIVVSTSHRCVATLGMDVAQRASFAYFGRLKLDDARDDCEWLLVADRVTSPLDPALVPGPWRQAWRGQRPVDRQEQFRLFRRTAG